MRFSMIWGILIFFPFFSICQAPPINFKHIRYDDGLSNSTIECIYQDSRGFIWLGTRDGLNRYDGSQQVKIFKYEPANAKSISDNYITSISEDKSGKLWVGTTNGLNCFDPTFNQFTRYKNDAKNPGSISNNYITSILYDRENGIWIGTLGGGLNLLNTKRPVFTTYRNKPADINSLANDKVYALFKDNLGKIWVGTEQGVQLLDQHTGLFKTPGMLGTIKTPVSTIKEDKAGNLIVGTVSNGLFIFNYQLNSLKQFSHSATNNSSLSSNLVRAAQVTRQGNIWIGTVNGGLDLFDPVSGRFSNYQYEIDNPQSLSQRTVSALFEDNQENLWVGTHRGGVNLYMPRSEKFNLSQQESIENSLSYNDIKSFCEDRHGNIWIGTDGGGLNLFDRDTKKFTHFKFNPADNHSLGSNEVIGITEDNAGNLWVATWGGGLCLFNSKTRSFTRFTHNPSDTNSISSNYIQAVFEDSKKRLWIATYYGGLNFFDYGKKKFSGISSSASGKTKLTGKNIVSINEDKKGNIWLGTDDGGLNCLLAQTGEFSQYFNNEEKKPDLRIIFTDSKGRLWAGQKGLYLFDEKQNRFVMYTSKGGLSEEFIKGIEEDSNGDFWIATSNGITQFNPQTGFTRKYNTSDGLQGLEFEANACLKTRDGQLFFGGVNGFNSFYSQHIKVNNFIPPVYITDVQLLNGEKLARLKKDISFSDNIELSYRQATFTFMFAALNYTASENNRFAYKLEDWDKDWIVSGKDKKAAYTNVSPGKYVFRVKASNNDGVWNEQGQSITVFISPPFWDAWWFKIIIGLILGMAIYTYYNFKQKMQLQKVEEEKNEEMHQSQLQFFTNISHEFRTPLSLIAGPIEKLMKDNPAAKETNTYKVIQKNASRLLQLINELMDFRKAESGILKLQVMHGNVPAFLEELSEEFSELAIQKNIQFSIDEYKGQKETWFDRQVLEKIIINLLSNSFKYTGDNGKITLQVITNLDHFKPAFANELVLKTDYQGGAYLYFHVSDNGSGIDKDALPFLFQRYYRVSDNHLGSGIGLAFVKNLTQLHKGNIYVYSEGDKGTEIIIGIPCGKNDYSSAEKWTGEHNTKLIKLESLTAAMGAATPPAKIVSGLNSTDVTISATILIADDNEELRVFLREVLEKQYRIIEACDGKAALGMIEENLPDIIISDIMMPVMDGISFCRNIKTNLATSHIPFIMLTAKDGMEARIEGAETGADHYFSKPVSMEILQLTIRNILTQKQKLKERYQQDYNVEIKDLVSSSKDRQFMDELVAIIEANLSSPELDIDFVCTQIGMSRTKLYNKIKGITGQAIGDFIRTFRLKKAAQLMVAGELSITEVMYSVGIQTQSYFTKAFKNEFGNTPTQYLKELKK